MKNIPSLLVLFFLSACAATRGPAVAALEGSENVEIQYSSRVSGAGVAPSMDAPWEAAPDDPTPGSLVQVECRLLEIAREDANAMLGVGVRAQRASRRAAESALDRLERDGKAKSLHAPRLTLFDGKLGSIKVFDERAFVEAFEITETTDAASGERALIADPVVATAHEGVQVEARPSVMPDGSTVRLEFGLRTADILDSVPERKTRIPGVEAAMTMEQPLAFTQLVSASADLDPDTVLVVGGLPTEEEGRVLVAFVAARAAAPETAMAGDR